VADHRYTVLDVFTAAPLEGNPLAVVHGADAVDEETMLRLARETRLSETTFVQAATEPGADYRNRIWMTTRELPFAGHPSLGTAVAVARERGEPRVTYVQQTRTGLQPIDVDVDGTRARASMLQEPATMGPILDPATVLAAAGLDARDADPALPPQVVSTGVPQVLVPVAERATLGRARPDPAALAGLVEEHHAVVLYLVHCPVRSGVACARSFFPGADGVTEDPATGGAAGPLCAYLHARTGAGEVVVAQGIEMGRPSRLETRMEGDRVRVGGQAVVIVDGTLRL
jgi:trans-2,3-dihydro-3-hydroxyanthranilate isomerase